MKRLLAGISAVVLFLLGLSTSERGFERVLEFRMLERIPLTSVLGSVGGETQIKGAVIPAANVLQSPKSKTDCVYFSYKIEEEYRDSDGDRRWRTIHWSSNSVDFYLQDESGRALVKTGNKLNGIDWSIARKYYTQEGKRRYTEWRVDLGDEITSYGWLTLDHVQPILQFDTKGKYVPIISSFSGSSERSDISASAIFALWGGISALIAMSFCVVYAMQIHRVLVFLVFITLSTTILLTSYGIKSLESDVSAGFNRVDTQRHRTEELINSVLQQYNLNFPGWDSAFDTNEGELASLSSEHKQQINTWRNVSYELRKLYLDQIDRFPENVYAIIRGLANPTAISLPPDQLVLAKEAASNYTKTKTSNRLMLTLLGLCLVAASAVFAFLQIRVKRIQENIPTSKTAGVVFGLAEVKGTLTTESDTQTLTGPVSGKECTWYHYIVKEKRGSGKNSRWVTITDEIKKQPFLCRDNEGTIRIFPGQAEIFSNHKSTRRSGSRRYIETRLEPNDSLYVLGKTKLDKTSGDSLVFSHEKGSPYIIANKTEEQVMFIKAARGMAILSAGVSLLFLCALWIGGSNGNFSSIDFILSSLIGPMFLSAIVIVLMYNDLVFLRKRCDRDWSNIQVSLKKRATLIPQIESVVKKFMEHEKELQEKLSKLRSGSKQVSNSADLDKYMAMEYASIEEISMRVEAYPELKSETLVANLSQRLIKLENEIALIRAGFNNAVMTYNNRVEMFPDNILAKSFHFTKLSPLQFTKAAHPVRVKFDS